MSIEAKNRVIEIARLVTAGYRDIPDVLRIARSTCDRHLLRVCLDCFSSVLKDSWSPHALDVAKFLAALLRDPEYRRIRRSILITLTWIGAASYVALPEILAVFKARGRSSILVPSRWASISVPWDAILCADATARAAGVQALESLGTLGLNNLRLVPRHLTPADPLRPVVLAASRGSRLDILSSSLVSGCLWQPANKATTVGATAFLLSPRVAAPLDGRVRGGGLWKGSGQRRSRRRSAKTMRSPSW